MAVTLLLTLTAIYITASEYVPKLNYPTGEWLCLHFEYIIRLYLNIYACSILPSALSELYTSCLTFTICSLIEAGASTYLVTMARDAKNGSMQWQIPSVTVCLDWIFWYVYIGGIVFRRKVKQRWKTKNFLGELPTTRRDDTVGKTGITDAGGKDDGVFAGDTVVDSIAKCLEQAIDLESIETNATYDPGKISSRLFALDSIDDLDASSSSNDNPESHQPQQKPKQENVPPRLTLSRSEASKSVGLMVARDEDQVKEMAVSRQKSSTRPTYWSVMTTDNEGYKACESTKELLVRQYLGEKDLEIKKSEILQCKRNFYIATAIAIDQLTAIVFPVSFAIYFAYFTMRWNIDWKPIGEENVLMNSGAGELPILKFVTSIG